MPFALEKAASRRHGTVGGTMTAGLPAQLWPVAGHNRFGACARDGKKRTPERSATQNLSASRSGASWQGGRGKLPPGPGALQGRRKE